MKKCAYCDRKDEKITKEHVVNKSFINRYYKVGKGYVNAYDKYTQNYMTIKDVCSKCNNECLSLLDTYFLDFYEANLPTQVIDSSAEIEINYHFEKLARWILKTLYNSERMNAYEFLPQKMRRFKNYILEKDNRTKLFKIYVELLQDVPQEEIIKYGHVDEEEIPIKLNFLRIGNAVISNQLTTGIDNTIKYIISSNFVFHVFVLDPGRHSESVFNQTLKIFCKLSGTNKIYYLNPSESSIILKASERTIINILEKTYEGNKHVSNRMGE